MKRKIIAVLLVTTVVFSMLVGCGSKAKETTATSSTEETKKDGDYQFVSAADTVKAAKDASVHVLDVREWANYVEGRVINSEWCPIFPLEDDSLVESMTTYANEKLQDDKDIYIVCNSGQRGAQKATKTLQDAGIDDARIFTVEGGAKSLAKEKGALTTDRVDDQIDWKYAPAADVLKAIDAGDVQIVDVRDDDTYAKGHLKGSLQVNLKDIESADAQTKMYELATTRLDKSKPVYLLCYSGNKCAKTGISVLKDAGFDTDTTFIITDGAKDKDIEAAFVTD